MRDRKKRNIIIGVLCCMLVIMGIGYAILSQTLNISGIANMKGNWNVKITNMELIKTTGMAEEVEKSFTDTSATFKGKMYIPGDSAEYRITVTNAGNLDARLESISENIEDEVSEIKFTNNIVKDRILKSGETYQFIVKAIFNETATAIPDKAKVPSYTITLNYVQYDRDKTYNIKTVATKSDCFTITSNGAITGYDYSCGTDVVVPDEINNIVVKSIEENAFLLLDSSVANLFVLLDETQEKYFYVFKDQETLDLYFEASVLDGVTREQYKKNIENEVKENNTTIEEWLKEISGEQGREFKTIDEYIDYLVNELKSEIVSSNAEVVLLSDIDISNKKIGDGMRIFKATNEDGQEIMESESVDSVTSVPITELDLSKTKHLEKANCFYNMLNLKKLNLNVSKPFSSSVFLNQINSDTDKNNYITLDEVIVNADTYSAFSEIKKNGLVIDDSINKLIILDGNTNHTIGKSNLITTKKVKEIVIENGIEEIGNEAFYQVEVEKITLPSSMIKIGYHSLAYTNLTTEGLGKLPSSLEQLNLSAFYGSKNLTQIILTSEEDLDGWHNGDKIWLGEFYNRETNKNEEKWAQVVYER